MYLSIVTSRRGESWGGGDGAYLYSRRKRAEEGHELTRFLGFTSERILFMDSPSDLPSKSIYNIEHLKSKETSFSGLVTTKMRKKRKEVRWLEKEEEKNALIASIYCH